MTFSDVCDHTPYVQLKDYMALFLRNYDDKIYFYIFDEDVDLYFGSSDDPSIDRAVDGKVWRINDKELEPYYDYWIKYIEDSSPNVLHLTSRVDKL